MKPDLGAQEEVKIEVKDEEVHKIKKTYLLL